MGVALAGRRAPPRTYIDKIQRLARGPAGGAAGDVGVPCAGGDSLRSEPS
jgi:hypothetical protein